MYEALLKVQQTIGAIKKDSDNPFYKSKYFDINSLLAVVKPVLNENGFVLTQALCATGGEVQRPALRTTLIHVSTGNTITDFCPLPEVPDAQKAGSAITYFRRYALQSLLALEAEDDDGNVAATASKSKMKPTKVVYPTPQSEGIDTTKPPFEDDLDFLNA